MSMVTSSVDSIEELANKLQSDRDLASLLRESLQKAKTTASVELDRDLFEALEWPLSVPDDYIKYLTWFSKWIPQQSSNRAWTAPGTDEQQEVYDHLCHFYWLIDQEVGPNGKIVENNEWFSEWLIRYANLWGSFLDTTESFNNDPIGVTPGK